MKKVIEWAQRYTDEMTLMDVALLKICLLTFGLLIGMKIKDEKKKCITSVATGVFATTYITLITKGVNILREMLEKKK